VKTANFSLGGISGVTSFFPEQIKEDRESLKLFVTALNIGDRVVFNDERKGKGGNRFISDLDTIFLDYKDNIFNLEFSTFNYGVAEQIHYRYKMEGLNDTWISTNPGVNRIHFTNIDFGTYKLKVTASLRDLESEVREITIIISPPMVLDKLSNSRLHNPHTVIALRHCTIYSGKNKTPSGVNDA